MEPSPGFLSPDITWFCPSCCINKTIVSGWQIKDGGLLLKCPNPDCGREIIFAPGVSRAISNLKEEPLQENKEAVDWLLEHYAQDKISLTDWEVGFLDSCKQRLEKGGQLTPRMQESLDKIWGKIN